MFTYVSLYMFRTLKITLLIVMVTFKQQPNFNSMNICYFDWRTFKLDAFNPDLILVCVTLLISNVAYCWSNCHATQFKGLIKEQVFHWPENVIFIKVNFKKKIAMWWRYRVNSVLRNLYLGMTLLINVLKDCRLI